MGLVGGHGSVAAPRIGLQSNRHHGGNVVAHFGAELCFGLRYRIPKPLQPRQPGGGEQHAARPGIVRVGPAGDQAPGLALVYQLRHGLLGHARALGQVGQPVAPQGQVPREVDVRGAHLVACGQVGQGQGHFHIARHELQHPRIKAPQGVAHQAAQVRLAPGIVVRGIHRRGGEGVSHAEMVNQTDQIFGDV